MNTLFVLALILLVNSLLVFGMILIWLYNEFMNNKGNYEKGNERGYSNGAMAARKK